MTTPLYTAKLKRLLTLDDGWSPLLPLAQAIWNAAQAEQREIDARFVSGYHCEKYDLYEEIAAAIREQK